MPITCLCKKYSFLKNKHPRTRELVLVQASHTTTTTTVLRREKEKGSKGFYLVRRAKVSGCRSNLAATRGGVEGGRYQSAELTAARANIRKCFSCEGDTYLVPILPNTYRKPSTEEVEGELELLWHVRVKSRKRGGGISSLQLCCRTAQ